MPGQSLPDVPVQQQDKEEPPSKTSHTMSSGKKLQCSSDWHCFSLLRPVRQKAAGTSGSPNHSISLPFYSEATFKAVSAMWEQVWDHSHTCDRAGITERRGRFKKQLTVFLLVILYFKEEVLMCFVQLKCNVVSETTQTCSKKKKEK